MSRPAPLTIRMASGFVVELDQGYQPSDEPAIDTQRVRCQVRMPPQCSGSKGDTIVAAHALLRNCHTYSLTRGDNWVLHVGDASIDLDSVAQAHQAERWLQAFRDALVAEKAKRLEAKAA